MTNFPSFHFDKLSAYYIKDLCLLIMVLGTLVNEEETYGSTDNNLRRGPSEKIGSRELKSLTKATIPLAISFFLQYLIPVSCVFAASRIGPKELSAMTLGTSSFTVTGLSLYQGFSTCLDSLCSQAYGAGDFKKVGLYFQRCSMTEVCITAVFLAPIWWNSGYILNIIVKDEQIVELAQQFLRTMIFGAPGLLFFETGKRFLQAQHIYKASTYILGFVGIIHLGLIQILVLNANTSLGFFGISLALCISYWLMSISTMGFVLFIDGKTCWIPLNLSKITTKWYPLFSLGFPGFIIAEAEYLASQFINFFAASFGATELAAQSITSNVGFLFFQISFSLSVAASTRLGYFVGSKNLGSCLVVIRVSILIGLVLSIFNFSVITINRHLLGKLFTSSKDVLELSDRLMIFSATNQLCDVINVTAAGLLRGQGRQRTCSMLTLISYYFISFPTGYYLGIFKDKKLAGLWIGYIAGVQALALFELWFIFMGNWEKIFNRASSLQRGE